MIAWRAAVLLLAIVLLVVVLAIAALTGPQSGCNTAGANLPTPPGGQLTAGQMVRYLQSTGDSANAAAGIVGNLVQESGLNPAESDGAGGGGLAQWNSTWYHSQGPHGEPSLDAFARAHRLQPATDTAQLMYLAYDLRTAYSSLLTQLNTAADPGTAATMFETGYELCSGVIGFMQVRADSLCMDPNRRAYAIAALGQAGALTVGGASAIPVSFVTGTACAASFLGGSGHDPIPGFHIGRDDMGVDACATPGQPIIAPAPSTLVDIVPDWYKAQPLSAVPVHSAARRHARRRPVLVRRRADRPSHRADGHHVRGVAGCRSLRRERQLH
jgi:hypothetical protein